VLGLWQPRDSIGAQLVNDPGAMCLNQLNTPEPEEAQRFHAELFGWRFEEVTGAGEPGEGIGAQPAEPAASAEGIGAQPAEPAASAYWGIYNGDALNGGMMPLPAEAGPPHWLVYFTTAGLDGSVAQIEDGGGRVLVPPTPIPSGRIAVARDPQGAVLGLFEGRTDP
jgi:predicted enzyme related to lactoylglutathione lyase